MSRRELPRRRWVCSRCGAELERVHMDAAVREYVRARWLEEVNDTPPPITHRMVCPRRRWWRWRHDAFFVTDSGLFLEQRWL